MKKQLLVLFLSFISFAALRAQCVPSCSVYAYTPITCSNIPVAGHNTITSFSSFDDGMSGALNIGFTFDFYCNSYTQFQASTNGFITFDLNNMWNNGCCSGQSLPSSGQPDDLIALHWNDLNLNLGGSITYTTVGTSPNQRCIISWNDVPRFGFANELTTGHIILYEGSNEIEIHSVSIDASSNAGTQGIEDANGMNGLPVPGRDASTWNASNSAYRFFAGGVPTPPTGVTGNTSLCEGTQATFNASPMPGALSYVWSLPAAWTGTSSTSVLTATAGVSGNVLVMATYSCGTSVPTAYSVTVIPAPVIDDLTASPMFMCSGNTVTIDGQAPGATVYTLQPLGFIGSPPFSVTPSVTTTYYLEAENSAGCLSYNPPMVTVIVKETPTVSVLSGSVCLGSSFNLAPTGATNYTVSSLFSVVTPTAVGQFSYSVIGTNSTGCLSNEAISNVMVIGLPSVTANVSPASICVKESATLSAGGASSFVWSNGSSGNEVTVTPGGPVVYTVTGMSAGCTNTATVSLDVISCTGISTLQPGAKNMAVYPNPSSGEYTIDLPAASQVVVYDIAGKKVFENHLAEGKQKINLQQLPAGKYLLKSINDQGQAQTVLIKF